MRGLNECKRSGYNNQNQRVTQITQKNLFSSYTLSILMTLFRAFLCQALALILTLLAAYFLPILHYYPAIFLLCQSTLAVIASQCVGLPRWWRVIHFLFLPCVFVFFMFPVPAWVYFALVVLMTLIFWGTVRGDVPLFLSSDEVALSVIALMEAENVKKFADLGAGIGTVALPVANAFSHVQVDAWERAPIPWLISTLRGKNLANYTVSRRNLFEANFAEYDVIFAFLSPRVMPDIGEQLQTKMRKGALFISSSFPVPDWTPERILQIHDSSKTLLYCYRIY